MPIVVIFIILSWMTGDDKCAVNNEWETWIRNELEQSTPLHVSLLIGYTFNNHSDLFSTHFTVLTTISL
jgi:hypothetical protein